MTDLSDLAKELFDLKDQKERIEEHLKEINGRIRQLAEFTIPESMGNRDIDKFSVPGVGTVYLQAEVRSNILKDDRERFYDWLRQSGHGEVVVDYVHPKTLNAFVKEQLSNGETLPEFVNISVVPTARLRRS